MNVKKPEPHLYYDWFDIIEYFKEIGEVIDLHDLPYMYEVENGSLFHLKEEFFDDCQQEGYIKLKACLNRIIQVFGNIEMKVWW